MPNDLRALSRDLGRAIRAVDRACEQAQTKTMQAVRAEAVRRSSGRTSLLQLAREDHPYATRHGSPRRDPSTINAQSGAFRRSWVIDRKPGPKGVTLLIVSNRSPVARYLEDGTKTMFSRPLKEILERTAEDAWAKVAPGLFAQALTNVFDR